MKTVSNRRVLGKVRILIPNKSECLTVLKQILPLLTLTVATKIFMKKQALNSFL